MTILAVLSPRPALTNMDLAVDTLPFATKTTLATSAMASFTVLQPPTLQLLLEAQVGRQHHCTGIWQHNAHTSTCCRRRILCPPCL